MRFTIGRVLEIHQCLLQLSHFLLDVGSTPWRTFSSILLFVCYIRLDILQPRDQQMRLSPMLGHQLMLGVCRLDIFSISMLPVHRWRYSLDLRPAVVPSSFWCITRDWINFHGDWMPLPIHQFGDEIHLQETVEALPVTT